MFKSKQGFSSFSVDDLEKAKSFYSETLGLQVTETEMEVLEIEIATGNKVLVYPKDPHTPATFTVLNFNVENVEQAVDDLTSAGVRFEQYDNEDFQTDEKGISSGEGQKMAWFQDPAGNIIAVMEQS